MGSRQAKETLSWALLDSDRYVRREVTEVLGCPEPKTWRIEGKSHDPDLILCDIIELLKEDEVKSEEELRGLLSQLNLSSETRILCKAMDPTVDERSEYVQGLTAEKYAMKMSERNLRDPSIARIVFGEIGRIAYELAVNCIKRGDGGVIMMEVENKEDDVIFRIIARDIGQGIDDVEKARRRSHSQECRAKGRGLGLRDLTASWSPFKNGKIIYRTRHKTWTFNFEEGKFKITEKNNDIYRGTQVVCEITKKQLNEPE